MTGQQLFRGGQIYPLADGTTQTEALLIDGGRVSAFGSLDEMRSRAQAGAREIDLAGATLLPGLVDGHPHFLHFGAFEAACVNILDARNHAEIVARIKERAKITPPGEWIITTPVGEPHYFTRRSYRDLDKGMLPTREVLDAATPDHPVLIQAWAPRMPNIVAFNSLGLKSVGVTRGTDDRVCNVTIEKDGEGHPTGILRGPVTNYYTDDPFWLGILSLLPQPPDELWTFGAHFGQNLAHKLGVTACYEAHCMAESHVMAYRGMRDRGELSMRVMCALELADLTFDPTAVPTNEELLGKLALAKTLEELDGDKFRFQGVSMGRGGPCWPGYLRIHEEMSGPFGERTKGKTFLSKQVEELVAEYCLDHGIRLNMVQGGYRDQDDFFDTVAKLGRDDEVRSANWISQHNILITEAHCKKLAELGMSATTSMSFSWGKGDLYAERIGKHVWSDLVPLNRFLKHGVTLACGSDWGPKNIFEHIALAETHEFCPSGQRNSSSDHEVGRAEAIDMWTRNPAEIMGWDDIGSLTVGNHADIVITDNDPFTSENNQLSGTKVLNTLVGGRAVYCDGGLMEVES